MGLMSPGDTFCHFSNFTAVSNIRAFQIDKYIYILIRIYLRPQHKSGWLGRRVCLSDDETVARNVKGADSEIITGGVEAQTNYVKALHRRACYGHHWVSIATSFHFGRSWSWGWLPWGGGGGQADREIDQEELLELPTLWIAPAPMEHLLKTMV